MMAVVAMIVMTMIVMIVVSPARPMFLFFFDDSVWELVGISILVE